VPATAGEPPHEQRVLLVHGAEPAGQFGVEGVFVGNRLLDQRGGRGVQRRWAYARGAA
jgi:hypothetical protein